MPLVSAVSSDYLALISRTNNAYILLGSFTDFCEENKINDKTPSNYYTTSV